MKIKYLDTGEITTLNTFEKLNNTKVKVTPEQSEAIQKEAALIGYNWGTETEPIIKHTDRPFLYFDEGGIMFGDIKSTFDSEQGYTEIEILSEGYDYIKPDHYKQEDGRQTIDLMVDEFGLLNTAIFCELNAFKYASRMGKKPGEDEARERAKMEWYENKANELYSYLKNDATKREI